MSKIEPMLTSVESAREALGLGRTTLYSLINEGRLETVKLGRRTLVKVSSMKDLIEETEAVS
ncbi:helix-turn-helix domain-containing protein [Erythrobacter aureus]|uniref:DNA-binding protein n=1 Tax=Erythrobacter aureus TaxID=2182384 RepID=A0A345YAU3_9SPHN|nr:helix-turn-helix domain-containing protein [Erythrobacter aureus]AXK41045.1 DNA-binding protein [Erythrobacter aureus]